MTLALRLVGVVAALAAAVFPIVFVAHQLGHANGERDSVCRDFARRYPAALIADPGGCDDWVDEAKARLDSERVSRCLDGADTR